jgi:hypothetical protein
VFQVPFEGTAEATAARGEPAAKVYGGPETYTAGVSGQAVVVGGPCRLAYAGAGNVPPAAGTLSFWARPLDWTPGVQRFVFLVTLLCENGDPASRIIVYKVHDTTSVTILAEGEAIRDRQILLCPSISWQTGKWRHFALTWDAQGLAVYVNGAPVQQTPPVHFPTRGWDRLVLGTAYPGWAYLGNERTAIDELTIRDRTLTAAEVAALFQEVLTRNPELAQASQARAAQREQRRQQNLARAGGWVLASSFADYRESYTDNLVDGNPESAWRPKEPEYPQWLELQWRYPLRLNRIAFEEVPGHEVSAAGVLAWQKGRFSPAGSYRAQPGPGGAYHEVVFPEVVTDRVRLVLEAGTGEYPHLTELEAGGPPQALAGGKEPYWDAWYVWYPEPDKVHKSNSPRYFRKVFQVDDRDRVRTAFVQARSNDFYRLLVNGDEVAFGSTAIRPVEVTHLLRPGANVIAAVADLGSNPGQWGWGEFLAELSLNYADRTVRVGTDATWRTAATEAPGWQGLAFDDSGWLPAAPYVRPPGGPWGRIPYHCTSVREVALLDSAAIAPAEAGPGEALRASLTFRVRQPLRGDYLFLLDLGEAARAPERGDFSVVRAVVEPAQPTSTWAPGADYAVTADLWLPEFAPQGRLSLHCRAVRRDTGVALDVQRPDGSPAAEFASVAVNRYPEDALSMRPAKAALTFRNGQAAFRLDGRAVPPLFWRYCPLNSFERSHHYANDTGIHLHQFLIYPRFLDESRDGWADRFAELDQDIRNTLRVDPTAAVMVLVDLRPSNAWLKAHPGEQLVTASGALGPVSFASRAYEEEVHAGLRALIRFLKTKPYYPRLAAIKPMTCGVPDSGLGGVEANLWQQDRSKLTVGDYNPQAVDAFREWLRQKYRGDVGALREAWRDPAVTFESAAPVPAELVREGAGGGVFRDPTEGRMPFDYFEFLPGLLGRFYQRLAKLIKDETDGRVLVMVHYGYVIAHLTSCNTPAGMFQNNNFDLAELLADPNLDAYLGAPDYDRRRAGDPYTLYFPVDSITLHRRQYIADGDYRTFIAEPVIHGRQRSARETEAVLKRDLASCIIGNSGTWFSDMSTGSGRSGLGWFLDEGILATIRQLNGLFTAALEQPREPASEIAVFVSASAPRYNDAFYGSTLYRNLIVWTYWHELHRLGAPFDCYLMSDLGHPDLRRDYKLYILLNPFCLTDEERRQVDKLKGDGSTLLWFYAPGYIDDRRGLDPRHIGEVTGIAVGQKADKELMQCTVVPTDHPIVAGLEAGHGYAVKPFGYPESDRLHPAAFGPVFRVTDEQAVALARYADGSTAFAAREFPGWRSVYTAVPFLDSQTLRNLARWAGVHLYCDEDIVLDADNRFLMVHNGYDGARQVTLRLPGPMTVTDALDGASVCTGAREFGLDLPVCTTRVFRLSR